MMANGSGQPVIDPVTGEYVFPDELARLEAQRKGTSTTATSTTTPTMATAAPAPDPAPAPSSLNPQDIVGLLRSFLIDRLLPVRQGGRLAAFAGLQPLMNASPVALARATAAQRTGLRQQLQQGQQQISQALGPFGGGQIAAGQQQVMSTILPQLSQLYAQLPEQAQRQLLQLVTRGGAFLPAPAQTSTGTATSISPETINPQSLGLGLYGLFGLGRGIYNALPSFGAPPAAGGIPPASLSSLASLPFA